jgi:hypothetical protein
LLGHNIPQNYGFLRVCYVNVEDYDTAEIELGYVKELLLPVAAGIGISLA